MVRNHVKHNLHCNATPQSMLLRVGINGWADLHHSRNVHNPIADACTTICAAGQPYGGSGQPYGGSAGQPYGGNAGQPYGGQYGAGGPSSEPVYGYPAGMLQMAPSEQKMNECATFCSRDIWHPSPLINVVMMVQF